MQPAGAVDCLPASPGGTRYRTWVPLYQYHGYNHPHMSQVPLSATAPWLLAGRAGNSGRVMSQFTPDKGEPDIAGVIVSRCLCKGHAGRCNDVIVSHRRPAGLSAGSPSPAAAALPRRQLVFFPGDIMDCSREMALPGQEAYNWRRYCLELLCCRLALWFGPHTDVFVVRPCARVDSIFRCVCLP